MNALDAVCVALREAGLCDEVRAAESLSGGCIHDVRLITLADGMQVVAKISDAQTLGIFEEEAAGLEALAKTETVLTPQPLGVLTHASKAVLLMTALTPARADNGTWGRFGEELAKLHAHAAGDRYGFAMDNHLGLTRQVNTWCDDWVRFNAEYRLGYQLQLLRGTLQSREAQLISDVINRLDQFIPGRPRPSLLHGDLWSGNALAAMDAAGGVRIGVIDPACYIGDGWADIAMMRLFGGFPQACFDSYAAAVTDHDNMQHRIAVYQLYHVLNHITLFGRGYVAQAMAIARSLLRI